MKNTSTQKEFIDILANLLYNNQPKIDFTDPFSIANFLYDSGYRKVKKTAIKLENKAKIEALRNKTFQEMENTIDRLEKLLDDKCGRCIANEREKVAREFAEKLREKFTTEDKVCTAIKLIEQEFENEENNQ